MAALLSAMPSAHADWAKMNEDGQATFYVETSIKEDGSLRRIWQLADFRAKGSHGELSLRALAEYDCGSESYRALEIVEHSGQMASGHVLTTVTDPTEWRHVAPGTFAQRVLRIVCAR